jgi:hypothetical protein
LNMSKLFVFDGRFMEIDDDGVSGYIYSEHYPIGYNHVGLEVTDILNFTAEEVASLARSEDRINVVIPLAVAQGMRLAGGHIMHGTIIDGPLTDELIERLDLG